MESKPRTGRPRGPAIANACAGTAAGTVDIVDALIKESTHLPAWRPARAGAVMGMAVARAPTTWAWMTTEEFQAFAALHFPPRKRKAATMQEGVGIAKSRRLALLDGASPTKVEALACAHYALGLPLPVQPGDVAGFAAWVEGKFGSSASVASALGISPNFILDRMRGYDVNAGARLVRTPEVQIIRALDWVLRVGPHSPYGRRLPAPAFPGQAEEVS